MQDSSLLPPEVFISYASHDRATALQIITELHSGGVTTWQDQRMILGGENYGPKIVEGIKNCKVLVLLCSEASMRSKNVKQEIQLAWRYNRPYLPLVIEPMTHFPEQVEYWLEGWQWIEVAGRKTEEWLPRAMHALSVAGVKTTLQFPTPPNTDAAPQHLHSGLNGLRALARFTDQIWPLPATAAPRAVERPVMRDLGAPQEDVLHTVRLKDRVCLIIETDQSGHLLLLNEGTSGKIYCLCPSAFAPDTELRAGRTVFPRPGARHESFVVTGRPGREHVLAIISAEPLALDWMPADPHQPARELTPSDIEQLSTRLSTMDANKWTALATYFDVER